MEFIIGFIFVVWFMGAFLPWIFKNWLQLAGFAAVFMVLYHVTGGLK